LFPEGPALVPPAPGCFSQVGFDEGNAAQYVWYVPQNIAGLLTALGGRQAVADRLDRFHHAPQCGACGAVLVGR
jgi:putative alpha-1,2-mannosidase